jgi:hypothetical protein
MYGCGYIMDGPEDMITQKEIEMKTEWDDEIEKLSALIKAKDKEHYELEVKRAEYLCPCVVGDIIKTKPGGRFQRSGVVVKIIPASDFYGGFVVKVHWILMDGSRGKDLREAVDWDFTPIGVYIP